MTESDSDRGLLKKVFRTHHKASRKFVRGASAMFRMRPMLGSNWRSLLEGLTRFIGWLSRYRYFRLWNLKQTFVMVVLDISVEEYPFQMWYELRWPVLCWIRCLSVSETWSTGGAPLSRVRIAQIIDWAIFGVSTKYAAPVATALIFQSIYRRPISQRESVSEVALRHAKRRASVKPKSVNHSSNRPRETSTSASPWRYRDQQ